MRYYLLKHKINKGDLYIKVDYQEAIEMFADGTLPNPGEIYYDGKQPTDFYSRGGYAISENAKIFFENLNFSFISFIPITFHNRRSEKTLDAYLLKVSNILDCADHQKSEFFKLSDGLIRRVRKLVFIDGLDEHIFKLKNLSDFLFVSEDLKNKIEHAGLKGFGFLPIEEFSF